MIMHIQIDVTYPLPKYGHYIDISSRNLVMKV